MMGGHWGNAEHWSANATSLGFAVSNMPGVGAIAHYSVTESPSFGHVAYVRKVNADGSVDLQEYNWGCSHCYGVRCGVRPPRFIFLHGSPPPLKFALSDNVQVTGVAPSTLAVRSPSACDTAIAQEADGSTGQIILADMVRCGSGSSFYNRWKIQWSDGVVGWSAEDWLTKVVDPPIPGDFNLDDHVNEADFAHFHSCMTGADEGPPSAGCTDADLDGDNDVDMSDFSIFQRCLSGSAFGDPDCAS
jgi:surface antigen